MYKLLATPLGDLLISENNMPCNPTALESSETDKFFPVLKLRELPDFSRRRNNQLHADIFGGSSDFFQ